MTTDTLSILVTGLLRTPELLTRGVTSWNELRARGIVDRVLMVTWTSEADREPGLLRTLERAGVELIIRPDPPVRGIGNVWPQMLAMETGLDHLSGEALVFKTRADLWLDPELLESLARTRDYLSAGVPPGAGRVFEDRVWVPWFELTTPFYLSDECFLGRAADLRKLINYDESYSLRYPVGCGITHYRRFVHPFRDITDRFEPFLAYFTRTGLGEPDRWECVRHLLASDAYLETLASAYAIYASHFRFESPDGSIQFRDWSSGTPQPVDGPMAASFEPSQAGLSHGHLFCRNDRWLHRLLSGDLPSDQLGDRFARALEAARASGLGWTSPVASLDGRTAVV